MREGDLHVGGGQRLQRFADGRGEQAANDDQRLPTTWGEAERENASGPRGAKKRSNNFEKIPFIRQLEVALVAFDGRQLK